VGRALRLIEQLPIEARVNAGHVVDGWSVDRELLALVLEVLDSHRLDFIRVNSKKGGAKLPKPMRFPRPWDAEKPKTTAPLVDAKGAAAFFAGR